MAESWSGVVSQGFDNSWEKPSNNSNNGINWERQMPPGNNWGSDRAPSENNWNVNKKPVQGSWGQNKSENSWASRNNNVDQQFPLTEAKSGSGYKNLNDQSENEEEKSDVGIQQSYETLKKIELDEDVWENYGTASKPQLDKSITTPLDDEMQYDTSNVYKAKGRVEPLKTSSFQEIPNRPNKEFRDIEVQTDPIDLSAIIASKEKLLSCTIGLQIKEDYQHTAQDLSEPFTNSVSGRGNVSQPVSLLDVDNIDSWNEHNKPDFREGSAAIPTAKPDTNSRGEVTVPSIPDRESWSSNTRSQEEPQNDSWNNSQQTLRNGNRNITPQMIPPKPDTWGAIKTTPAQDESWPEPAQNDNRNNVTQQMIPPKPDTWGAIKTTPAQDESWPEPAQNDNRNNVQMIPPKPDTWGAIKTTPAPDESWSKPAQNDNRDNVLQQMIPPKPDTWGAIKTTPAPDESWSARNDIQNNNLGSDSQKLKEPPASQEQFGVSNDNLSGMTHQSNINKASNRESHEVGLGGDQWGASTNQPAQTNNWLKQAESYSKELGESNEVKANQWGRESEQKAEDSYDAGANDSYYNNSSYDNSSYNNSSSNNRYSNSGCRNCGQEGHFARDCPGKRQGGRACHKCGKEGHISRECTEGGGRACHKCGKEGHFARECTEGGGKSCHKCGKEGHFARDCTESSGSAYGGGYSNAACFKCKKPGHRASDCKEDAYEATGEDGRGVCFKCKQPGHRASECTEEHNISSSRHRKLSPFSNPEPSDISSQEAWDKLLKADREKDHDDFKEAVELYAKVTSEETFQTIERKLRAANCNGRIVALEREEIPLTKVLVDLQGNTNKKYVASTIMGPPSRLPRTAGERAKSEAENFEWLANSGFMVDDTTPICFNCKQKGHITKECLEPKREIDKPSYLTCQNCNSSDHMTKFCELQRRDYYEEARRKVTGGHKGDSFNHDRASYDGEDDRKGSRYGGQTCHNCNREGHISRDCPEPRRTSGRKCHKCGEEGHMSRDCTSTGNSGGDYDRGNYNSSSNGWQRDSSSLNDKTATWGTQDKGDDNLRDNAFSPQNSWNKDNSSQNQSMNDTRNAQNKGEDTPRQKDEQPVSVPYKVEKDSWEAKPASAATQPSDWGSKTAEDFGWDKKISTPDINNENKRVHGNEPNESYERRQPRGNEQNESYESRRSNRGYEQNESENRRGRQSDYENRRSNRGYEQNDSYDNRRSQQNDYENRRNNRGYEQYDSYDNKRNQQNDYENRRGRYEQNDSYDNRRGQQHDYENRRGQNDYNNKRSDYENRRGQNDYENRRGRGYEQSESYENRQGRGYEHSESGRQQNDSYGNRRGRGNEGFDDNRSTHSSNKQSSLVDAQQPWW